MRGGWWWLCVVFVHASTTLRRKQQRPRRRQLARDDNWRRREGQLCVCVCVCCVRCDCFHQVLVVVVVVVVVASITSALARVYISLDHTPRPCLVVVSARKFSSSSSSVCLPGSASTFHVYLPPVSPVLAPNHHHSPGLCPCHRALALILSLIHHHPSLRITLTLILIIVSACLG